MRVPSWNRYKPKEVEVLVTKAAKEGLTPSEIGVHMRDIYGIPDVKLLTEKSISAILKEKGLLPEMPSDLMALIHRDISIREHLAKSKKDLSAKRGLQLTESKIRRLGKYYRATGKLPMDWKYDPERIKLLIE